MSRTERTYYLIFGLYNLSWAFIGSMYALFLLDRGLDLFQMSVVPAVFWIVSFLFEVPTGAFADLAGRKSSFVLSCMVRMVAFGMYAFADGFGEFLAAEFVDALGATLANGALDAWAVDSLRSEGDARPTDRFFARAQMIARLAIIASGLAGGYLAQRNLILPWLASAVAFAVTAGVAVVWMRESRSREQLRSAAPRTITRMMRQGFSTVRQAPILLLLCGLTFAAAFAVMPTHMLWQPRLQALTGEGLWLMGWIWALINAAALLGSALVPRLLGRFDRENVLAGAMLWRATSLAVAAVASTFFPVLTGVLLMELGFGLTEPLLQAWINEHIPSQQRATVLSVRSMFLTLGGGSGLVCIGALARGAGIPIAWSVSAFLLALIAPGFLILRRRLAPGRAPIGVSAVSG
jgi:MFS family permease